MREVVRLEPRAHQVGFFRVSSGPWSRAATITESWSLGAARPICSSGRPTGSASSTAC
jgi:hypothetical protein